MVDWVKWLIELNSGRCQIKPS